jgi:hypothetical protein
MATTIPELIDWLKTLDEVSILELLDISAEELVERFGDYVEDNYDRLLSEREAM